MTIISFAFAALPDWRKIAIALFLGLLSCHGHQRPASKASAQIQTVIVAWNRLFLDLERFTPGYRAPTSARAFAYTSLAAYEAALPGNAGYLSTAPTLPGCLLPTYTLDNANFCVTASLNAAYSAMATYFFPNAPQTLKEQIQLTTAEFRGTSQPCIDAALFGQQIATAVFNFANTDGKAELGGVNCPFSHYKVLPIDSTWQVEKDRTVVPLLPYWGCIRPIWASVTDLNPVPPAKFSEKAGSTFYNQAMEVFSTSQPLSKENQWIAEFWSDDVAGLTITPAGRWISIATQAIEQDKVPWPQTLEIYLRTSIALHDALIACWALKYKYNLERPQTYICRVIHKDWKPYMDSPPFPAYPAGHAMLSSAACEVLLSQFGDPYTLCDATHKGRKEFAGMPRTFHSFRQMAQENAFSRVVTGVHYRIDCEEGMRLGKAIGDKVAAVRLQSVTVGQ